MKSLLVLALALLLPILSTSTSARDLDVDALAAASLAWDRAYAAGDASKLAELYDDDAVSMPPGMSTLPTKSAIVADFTAFFASNRATHRTLDADRRVTGEFAIERARYEAAISPKDGAATIKEAGKHIVVYRRQTDGSWKVFWEIWNSDK
jgi:uncharacterized protein (TIGR02246 family)